MKTIKTVLILAVALAIGAFAIPSWWHADADREENDPDLPAGIEIDKGEYIAARDEQIAYLRGLDTAEQGSRSRAIREMEESERRLARPGEAVQTGAWRPLGPVPIPNGQTLGRSDWVSGRTSAIAVDPRNRDIVYAGTAQGGLYRSIDGAITWTPMLDRALSLAIGAVAVAPSDPSIVYVGTGESGGSLDSFFGVGIYRIDGADGLNPVVTGPLNKDAFGSDIFTGRGIGRIFIHPTDPNIIFAGTVAGSAGLAGTPTGASLPARGLYRSTNAASANPVFERLTVSTAFADRPILDIVAEPGNPNAMFVTLVDTTFVGDGGIYFSTNALSPSPAFTRIFTTGVASEASRGELTIQKTGSTVTVYCAHGTSGGRLSSTTYNSGLPATPAFTTLPGGVNFCSPQCLYDIALAVDPTDSRRVYLAGSPAMPFGYSTDGGMSFSGSVEGLHVDTHVIAVAPSDPNTLYYGSDGGIWRSDDQGLNWTSCNTETYSATQFESVAVHPNDRHYTLGGTQDNGTEYLFPDGKTWTRAVGGDGGMVVIDSHSASPTSLISYHTFFNRTDTVIGFARSTQTLGDGTPLYGPLLGCGGVSNGISCSDATIFYAPLVLGPDSPGSDGNTVYFGTNKLYRSIDGGSTMNIVSQTLPGIPNERVSAVAISPQNDAVRLIGSNAGRVYYSSNPSATTMNDITGAIPARYVGRIAIAPDNQKTAYVALNGFGIPDRHVMKTTDLDSPAPTWTAAGVGIPDVPTNGLVIDPSDPNIIYAGTDIGVFRSINAGASWTPFSNGLPRVAVFQITIQPRYRILKIATHGRGIWEYDLNAAREAQSDFDGDGKSDVSVFRPSNGVWYLQRSQAGETAVQFGVSTDRIAPADYDGDGKTDIAVYRPSQGAWYIYSSLTSSVTVTLFGVSEDLPVPGDYDGDGKADIAVFRPSAGTWFLQRSTAGLAIAQFGANGDVPTPGDYDGDGKNDLVVWRPSNGVWYERRSLSGDFAVQFGISSDKVAPADYDGDGKADIGLYRPSQGVWYSVNSSSGGVLVTGFGLPTDIPTQGDYDGDGRADIAIYRPSNGQWWLNRTTSGLTIIQFGLNGDKPTPNAFGN